MKIKLNMSSYHNNMKSHRDKKKVYQNRIIHFNNCKKAFKMTQNSTRKKFKNNKMKLNKSLPRPNLTSKKQINQKLNFI